MASIVWKNNASGSWSDANNWNPAILPGAGDDASISISSGFTVTHGAGADTVASLYMNSGTLAMTGGSLTVLGNAAIYGNVTESAATLRFDGASSFINGVVTQTSGTIAVDSGILSFNGTANSLAGTLAGRTVAFASGSDTLASTLVLSVGRLLLSGATVTLAKSFSTAGTVQQTSGTLALGGNSLTVAGPLALDGGIVTGAGTIVSNGVAEADGYIVSGSAVLRNVGALTQTGYLYVGYYGSDTAQLVNAAGATYTLANAVALYGSAGGLATNAGLFVKQGAGQSNVSVSFTSTGTIAVNAGVLRLAGAVSTLGGAIRGNGTLDLASGASSFAAGATLSIGHAVLESGLLTLTANLAYAKEWTQGGGTLALGGKVLTLSGLVNLDGGQTSGAGTMAITSAGTGSVGGYYLTGSNTLTNSGHLTQTNYLYVGYNASDTAGLVNAAGGSYTIAGPYDMDGSAGGTFTNAGTLVKAGGGLTSVRVATVSTGTMTVAAGTLNFTTGVNNSFGGTIGGAGLLQLSGGADLLASGLALTVADVLLTGANVTLGGNLAYAGNWEQDSGTLSLAGKTLTLSTAANLDGGALGGAGTLALSGVTEMSSYYLIGSNVVSNTGSILQDGYVYDGYYGTDTPQLVNQAAGTYSIAAGNTMYGSAGASFSNAGRLNKLGGGTSQINVSASNTGTVAIGSGTLRYVGAANSFAGAVSGNGTLALGGSGATSFAAGLTLGVGHVLLSGSAVTLGANLTYAGDWTQTAGTLSLGGKVLALTGHTNLDGGTVAGTGTLAVSGTGEISSTYLAGSVVLSNTGSIAQTSYWYLGYAGTDTSKFNNLAGATFTMAGNTTIYGVVGSKISNYGNFTKTGGGGTSTIAASIGNASTGVITVASGVLNLTGSGNAFVGTIAGAGLLQLSAGTDLLQPQLHLNVASVLLSGADVTLSGGLAYAGVWSQTAGTLALGGKYVTLSGTGNLDGGVVSGAGTVTIGSTASAEIKAIAFEGSAALVNAGSLSQTGYWYLGYNATDTASLTNKAGATLSILANSDLYGVAGSTLNNAGTITKATGSDLSSIGVATINTGNVSVGSGTMAFLSTVSGAGAFNVAADATLKFGGAVAAGSAVTLGAGADLFVSATAGFAGSIAGFNFGNFVELTGLGFSGTSLSFNAGLDQLTAINGATSVGLQLVGAHTAGDFRLFSDAGIAAIAHT